MVRDISSQQDERRRVRSRASKAGHMPYRVARRIKQVKAAVAVEVVAVEFPYLQRLASRRCVVEIYLVQFAVLPRSLVDVRVSNRWVGRDEIRFEARPYDQIRRIGESSRIAHMVKVPVRPHDRSDVIQILPILAQNRGDVFLHADAETGFFDPCYERLGQVLPIFAHSKVEEEGGVFVRGGWVFDDVAVGAYVDEVEAGDGGLDEG